MDRFRDRVVLVTGAARGQGRSHALRFAAEGAVVVGTDVCGPISSVTYPMPGVVDLEQTATIANDAGGQGEPEHSRPA